MTFLCLDFDQPFGFTPTVISLHYLSSHVCMYYSLTFVLHILFCSANLIFCSEFIREDGDEKFWQFVDTVKELTVYKNGGNDIG